LITALIPVFITIILIIFAWKIWLYFIRISYISTIEWVNLEIRIPKEIHKSPLAMELVLNSMLQTYPGTWYHKYIKGIVRSWFSLELVSIEGSIHFFIRLPKIFKSYIESQIYSQYPQVEINEVPDYVDSIPSFVRGGEWSIFGSEIILNKPDPYPIKTYIDYGLDRAVGSLEEEEKVDPITPTLEFFGSIGPGEQIWTQILIRASMKKSPKKGSWFKKQDWKEQGKELIKEIKEPYKSEKDKFPETMTKETQEVINAIDRSISKPGFDCGIRVIYLAKKDNFQIINVPALLGIFKQYNSGNLNGFRPFGDTITAFDYPWQDIGGHRVDVRRRKMLDAYKLRSYFHPPYKREPFVLNTEELATIYHFPGKVSETPGFKRVESKKAEPPSNLPI